MAPELHKGQIYLKGKASDMWAVGCVLLEMLIGKPLWDLDFDLGTKSLEDPNFTRTLITEHE
jgi:serine/threonine protein kinase